MKQISSYLVPCLLLFMHGFARGHSENNQNNQTTRSCRDHAEIMQVSCGQLWSVVVSCGQLWSVVVSCGQLWSVVVSANLHGASPRAPTHDLGEPAHDHCCCGKVYEGLPSFIWPFRFWKTLKTMKTMSIDANRGTGFFCQHLVWICIAALNDKHKLPSLAIQVMDVVSRRTMFYLWSCLLNSSPLLYENCGKLAPIRTQFKNSSKLICPELSLSINSLLWRVSRRSTQKENQNERCSSVLRV